MYSPEHNQYHPTEEKLNVLIHVLGIIYCLYLAHVFKQNSSALTSTQQIGFWVYWVSLLLMFSTSSLYHQFSNTHYKTLLKKLDHCSIYALIAGTYTAILLLGVQSQKSTLVLWALWLVVVAGVFFKLFFVHRFKKLSLIIYLAMGWAVVFFWQDLKQIPQHALNWIMAGGILYTVGTLFYAAKKHHYTHAIWHVFVLVAAICQSVGIVILCGMSYR